MEKEKDQVKWEGGRVENVRETQNPDNRVVVR